MSGTKGAALTLGQRGLLGVGGAPFAAAAGVAVDRQAGLELPLHLVRHGQRPPGLLRHGGRRGRAGRRLPA